VRRALQQHRRDGDVVLVQPAHCGTPHVRLKFREHPLAVGDTPNGREQLRNGLALVHQPVSTGGASGDGQPWSGVRGVDHDPWGRTTLLESLADRQTFSTSEVVVHDHDVRPALVERSPQPLFRLDERDGLEVPRPLGQTLEAGQDCRVIVQYRDADHRPA
jgi:hypothetical protein